MRVHTRTTERISFPEFANETEMSVVEMKEIRGGTDHTLSEILAIFNFSPPSTIPTLGNDTYYALTNQQRTYFENIISQINSTFMGHQMLNALVDSGNHMYVSFNSSTQDTFQDSFNDDTTNVLKLGFLYGSLPSGADPDAYNEARDFLYIAHELFHAYQDWVAFPTITQASQAEIDYFNSVRFELDPELFATMAVREYDSINPIALYEAQLTDSRVHQFPNYYNNSPGSNQTLLGFNAFSSAWWSVMESLDFSMDAYNELLVNFKHGSNYGFMTPSINSKTANPITQYDNVIFFFLDGYFQGDADPVNYGYSGGGGGGGGLGGFTDPNANSYWFNAYINLLYSNNTLNPNNNNGQNIIINGVSYPVYPGSWVSSGGGGGGSWSYNNSIWAWNPGY